MIATQNPVEFHGTYPLPEAQLDRFGMKVGLGYPPKEQEVEILYSQFHHHPLDDVEPVLEARDGGELVPNVEPDLSIEALERYLKLQGRFKKSKLEFQDLLYQQLRLAGATQAEGAQVPVELQIGYGTRPVATQRIFWSRSTTKRAGSGSSSSGASTP